MVRRLGPPPEILPSLSSEFRRRQDYEFTWKFDAAAERWSWCRIYHRSVHTPNAVTFRNYGPLHRFDHHAEVGEPAVDPENRRVLYIAADLATAGSEVFGEAGVAQLCPRYRIGIVAPRRPLTALDLAAAGVAMAIGATPSLATGYEERKLTQRWARSIYTDKPAGSGAVGIHYPTANNFGPSLALWDCDEDVEVVRDVLGRLQDLPLRHSGIQERFIRDMRLRKIGTELIDAEECRECTKWPDVPRI